MKITLFILRWLLFPLSLIYGWVISFRHSLFNKGILKTQSFKTPSINVGNIAMGGTGKTPHIEYLIRLLCSEFLVATLSRGYKRETKGFVLAQPSDTAQTIGDEPKQIQQQFPNVQVSVDADRCHGLSQLENLEQPPQVVLLDDAFQHRYIRAGINILLTDYQKPYWSDYMFPTGYLRDVKSRAKKADIIIVSKCPANITKEEQGVLNQKIKPRSGQMVCFTSIRYGHLKSFSGDDFVPEANTAVLMLTGIANPLHLERHLQQSFQMVEKLTFPDHHHFTEQDFKQIITSYQKIKSKRKIIITTLKDAVRLKDNINFAHLVDLPLYYQSMEIEFVDKDKQNKFNKLILDYVREAKRDR